MTIDDTDGPWNLFQAPASEPELPKADDDGPWNLFKAPDQGKSGLPLFEAPVQLEPEKEEPEIPAPTSGYKLAPRFVDAIKQSEGFTPRAAWDNNNWRNGYGTNARYKGEVIDEAEADRRLQTELNAAYDSVNSFAPKARPGAKAALTSLTFNSGPKWQRMGLGALVQNEDWEGAKDRFLDYHKEDRGDGVLRPN